VLPLNLYFHVNAVARKIKAAHLGARMQLTTSQINFKLSFPPFRSHPFLQSTI